MYKTASTINEFRQRIQSYYKDNKRDLPWRDINDHYRIFISEVMLQQTQVIRVLEKYQLFIKQFPNFCSLSDALLRDILVAWQGMGYNRRALYLQQSAKIIVAHYKGVVPSKREELEKLPGIGPSTSGSLLVFCYNQPAIFIETNIRRVFIHFFFPNKIGVDDHDIYPLIKKTIDLKNPRKWYYSLMDYGSMLKKKIPNPNKKSKHHIIQKTFKGSDREIRGKIIRILLEEPFIKKDLWRIFPFQKERIKKAINDLEKEGLIRLENNTVSIA